MQEEPQERFYRGIIFLVLLPKGFPNRPGCLETKCSHASKPASSSRRCCLAGSPAGNQASCQPSVTPLSSPRDTPGWSGPAMSPLPSLSPSTPLSRGGWRILTEHGLRDGEGDGGPPGHPPAAAEVREVRPQHLHDHLVVESQVELLLVDELRGKQGM